MSNKIDGYGIQPTAPTGAGRVTTPAKPGAGSDGNVRAVPALDSVALTADAQSLQQLEKSIAALPEVDSARVEKIRAQLRDGSYPIDPRAIADSLARMEWELGS